jgi:hypothetical protein
LQQLNQDLLNFYNAQGRAMSRVTPLSMLQIKGRDLGRYNNGDTKTTHDRVLCLREYSAERKCMLPNVAHAMVNRAWPCPLELTIIVKRCGRRFRNALARSTARDQPCKWH